MNRPTELCKFVSPFHVEFLKTYSRANEFIIGRYILKGNFPENITGIQGGTNIVNHNESILSTLLAYPKKHEILFSCFSGSKFFFSCLLIGSIIRWLGHWTCKPGPSVQILLPTTE